jgi:NADPH2:quinone reductase
MTRAHAIRIHETGGPEVLRWEEVDVPPPDLGEAQVRHTAIGLNFIDTYQRSGLYKLPLPSGLGAEGAGIVEAVGLGVSEVAVGDRVAYGSGAPPGAYAEVRNLPAAALVRVPDAISDRAAAAVMLKGLTVHYLLRRTHRLHAGETVLLHAAAGGVGLLFCQWARALGATVIGTVGSEAKAELARAHGCTHTLIHGRDDIPARVRELTSGKGVPVVYDSVGKDTFAASLDSLAPLGLLVSFGQSSGLVPPLDLRVLSEKGSLFVTRPTLRTYTARRDDLVESCEALFEMVASGKVKVEIGAAFPLREAAEAHRALEGRKTTGSVVLEP